MFPGNSSVYRILVTEVTHSHIIIYKQYALQMHNLPFQQMPLIYIFNSSPSEMCYGQQIIFQSFIVFKCPNKPHPSQELCVIFSITIFIATSKIVTNYN